MTMRLLLPILCSLTLLAGRPASGAAQGAAGTEDPRLAEVRILYEREDWPAGGRRRPHPNNPSGLTRPPR